MATHSSILAWRIPMDTGAWRATVQAHKELDPAERARKHTHTHTHTTLPLTTGRGFPGFLGPFPQPGHSLWVQSYILPFPWWAVPCLLRFVLAGSALGYAPGSILCILK